MLRRIQLGRKRSPETRAKMSATHKARGTRPPGRRRTHGHCAPSPNSPVAADVIPIRPNVVGVVQVVVPGDSHVEAIVVVS